MLMMKKITMITVVTEVEVSLVEKNNTAKDHIAIFKVLFDTNSEQYRFFRASLNSWKYGKY